MNDDYNAVTVSDSLRKKLLPMVRPRVDGFSIFDFYSSDPQYPIGRDFFDYVETPAGQLAITAGDVFGFGNDRHVIMARVSGQLRSLLKLGTRPGTALQIVNRDLAETDLGMASAVIALLDPKTCVVELTNAGHCPALLSHVNGAVERPGESESGIPVGILIDGFSTKNVLLHLDRGDCLTLYTDGVVEATGEAGEMYGSERLMRRIEMLSREPRQIGAGIVDDLKQFVGQSVSNDSACLVCIARDLL